MKFPQFLRSLPDLEAHVLLSARVRTVEDDEQGQLLVRGEAMLGAGRNEERHALLERR